METLDLILFLPVTAAYQLAEETLLQRWHGQMADSQEIVCKAGRISVMLFESASAKGKGFQTVLVTIDNLTGSTRLHAAKAGETLLSESFRKDKDAFFLLEKIFSVHCE